LIYGAYSFEKVFGIPFFADGVINGLCTIKRFRSKVGPEAAGAKGIFGCLLATKGDK
jgi:hypothetical protein